MDVNVTQKELEAIQKVENMQISFLEYDLEKKCFSTEVPVGDISNGDVGVGPQGHRQLYEFWGPNKHQSLLWGRIQLEGKWRDVKLTIDSGSECTAISSATLDELWQRWRGKLKKNPGCTLSASEPRKIYIVGVPSNSGIKIGTDTGHWCLFCQYLFGIYSVKVISTEKWCLE